MRDAVKIQLTRCRCVVHKGGVRGFGILNSRSQWQVCLRDVFTSRSSTGLRLRSAMGGYFPLMHYDVQN